MFDKFADTPSTERMPVLFIGHGSPMNAIDTNPYTQALNQLGANLPRPRAILAISAHWMTEGTWVTEMSKPKTIHDFYGFPQALFDIQYPAPGSPEVAQWTQDQVSSTQIQGDKTAWGLDHGTWAVLRHMYPKADIPVVQLSLDLKRPAEYHIQIGRELKKLRDKGVLIVGSGNLVHNLRRISWEANAPAHDWALEFDAWLKAKLTDRDDSALLHDFHKTQAGRLSIPTLDHYLPLHYVLSAADPQDQLAFVYEEMQNASISMRSLSLG